MSRLDARFMTSAGYASRSAARTTADVPAAVLGSWLPSAACAGCHEPLRHADSPRSAREYTQKVRKERSAALRRMAQPPLLVEGRDGRPRMADNVARWGQRCCHARASRLRECRTCNTCHASWKHLCLVQATQRLPAGGQGSIIALDVQRMPGHNGLPMQPCTVRRQFAH